MKVAFPTPGWHTWVVKTPKPSGGECHLSKAYHKSGGSSERKLIQDLILPKEFVLEVNELSWVFREGLLAVGAKAALLIAQQTMEEELLALAGPKGKHQPGRTHCRHGSQGGFLVLGGQKVKIRKPRVRKADGEVELESYKQFQDDRFLDEVAMERMLHGLASRRYGQGADPIGESLDTYGASKSSVSRRFAEATEALLKPFLSRPLHDLRLLTVFIDGIVLGGHTVMVALGVDGEGRKHVLGMREGTTENAAVCTSFLEDLSSRGLCADNGLLFVVDGSKAISKAVRDVYGELALIQRCLVHKRRNVMDHLPERERGWVNEKLSLAWAMPGEDKARAMLESLVSALEEKHPGAAASLKEGLNETITVQRLKLPSTLRRVLRTTNAIESLNSQIRRTVRRVSRFQGGTQALRWAAVGALEVEPKLYRQPGYRQMPLLAEALEAHVSRVTERLDRKSQAG
jgi:transposase-like protein